MLQFCPRPLLLVSAMALGLLDDSQVAILDALSLLAIRKLDCALTAEIVSKDLARFPRAIAANHVAVLRLAALHFDIFCANPLAGRHDLEGRRRGGCGSVCLKQTCWIYVGRGQGFPPLLGLHLLLVVVVVAVALVVVALVVVAAFPRHLSQTQAQACMFSSYPVAIR